MRATTSMGSRIQCFALASAIVAAAHAGVVLWLIHRGASLEPEWITLSTSQPEPVVSPALVDAVLPRAVVPAPEILVKLQPVSTMAIRDVTFEDPDDNAASVVGSASTPRPVTSQSFDTQAFAQRAGLRPKGSAAVVLEVEIRADGTVGTVTVVQSDGHAAIDAAAIAYVRSLRWIPGTVDHQPAAMRIRFPVLLIRED